MFGMKSLLEYQAIEFLFGCKQEGGRERHENMKYVPLPILLNCRAGSLIYKNPGAKCLDFSLKLGLY